MHARACTCASGGARALKLAAAFERFYRRRHRRRRRRCCCSIYSRRLIGCRRSRSSARLHAPSTAHGDGGGDDGGDDAAKPRYVQNEKFASARERRRRRFLLNIASSAITHPPRANVRDGAHHCCRPLNLLRSSRAIVGVASECTCARAFLTLRAARCAPKRAPILAARRSPLVARCRASAHCDGLAAAAPLIVALCTRDYRFLPPPQPRPPPNVVGRS